MDSGITRYGTQQQDTECHNAGRVFGSSPHRIASFALASAPAPATAATGQIPNLVLEIRDLEGRTTGHGRSVGADACCSCLTI